MDESNFCPDCGVPLAGSKRYCASCGQEVCRATESNPRKLQFEPSTDDSGDVDSEGGAVPKSERFVDAGWLGACLYLAVFPVLLLPSFKYSLDSLWIGVARPLSAAADFSLPTDVWWNGSTTTAL